MGCMHGIGASITRCARIQAALMPLGDPWETLEDTGVVINMQGTPGNGQSAESTVQKDAQKSLDPSASSPHRLNQSAYLTCLRQTEEPAPASFVETTTNPRLPPLLL